MKAIILIFSLFVCLSCTHQTPKDNTSTNNDTESIKESNSLNTAYVFENDTLKQTVEISLFNEEEIVFKLISENKYRKQKALIEGIAKISISFKILYTSFLYPKKEIFFSINLIILH